MLNITLILLSKTISGRKTWLLLHSIFMKCKNLKYGISAIWPFWFLGNMINIETRNMVIVICR